MSASTVPIASARLSVSAYLPLLPPNRNMRDLVLRVDEARGRYDRGRFVGVAHRLYRGDRRWIPPTGMVRRNALRAERNPLLAGAGLGAFLGIAQNLGLGDEPVGSIAAWAAPAEDEFEEAWGAWGLFESINVEEMPERLFDEAENWLFEHAGGLAGIRGPLALEPLTAPGLLTDGFDAPSAGFLPYSLPYYPEMVEAKGYEAGMTWRAYWLDLWTAPRARVSDRGSQISNAWRTVLAAYSVAEGARGEKERAQGRSLTPGLMQWLAQLAGDEPFFKAWAWRAVLGQVFRRGMTIERGSEAGGLAACFGIPDPGPALRVTGGRLLPFGWALFKLTLHRTRRLRVFPAAAPRSWDARKLADLYRELAEQAGRAGYRQMVIAPIPDDDERSREAMSALHARPAQQFTVYEKWF